MGQSWKIINVDNGELCPPTSCKLGEFFWYERTLAALLFRRQRKLSMPKTEMAANTSCSNNTTSLLRLPLELLTSIVSLLHYQDSADVVSFALSSQTCWHAASTQLQLYIDHEHTAWAGARVICVGDYARGWPKGVLTEKEELEQKVKRETEGNYEGQDFGPYACGWYELSSPDLRYDMLERFRAECRWPRSADYDMADSYWQQVFSDVRHSPPPEQTVLRNLSKKVYVRQSALDTLNAAMAAEPNTRDPRPEVSFSHALLSRICWTEDPSCAMSCWLPDDMFPGPWAGDYFDIVLESDFEEGTTEGWMDESDRLVDIMGQMARTEECYSPRFPCY